MSRDKPKGIRNNNPGNIEWGDPWQGLIPLSSRTDSRFCQFDKPVNGIRAIAMTLITYQDKRRARDGSKIDSIKEIIERWAPPEDSNPTIAYAEGVADLLNEDLDIYDEVIDVHEYDHIKPIVEGIIRHENGRGPLKTANTWYAADVIDEGLRRAGITKRRTSVITKESTASVGVAGAGAAQLADSLPPVMDAMTTADAHVSSGNIVQVVLGTVIIGVAVAIAWGQYRKAQIGAS